MLNNKSIIVTNFMKEKKNRHSLRSPRLRKKDLCMWSIIICNTLVYDFINPQFTGLFKN